MMYENFTIKSVKLTKTNAGDRAIMIEGVPEVHKKYVNDWISEDAKLEKIARWWTACGISETEWSAFHSESGFDLVGQIVLVKLVDGKNKDKNGNFYKMIDEVRSLDYVEKTQENPAKIFHEPVPTKPNDDDIPF